MSTYQRTINEAITEQMTLDQTPNGNEQLLQAIAHSQKAHDEEFELPPAPSKPSMTRRVTYGGKQPRSLVFDEEEEDESSTPEPISDDDEQAQDDEAAERDVWDSVHEHALLGGAPNLQRYLNEYQIPVEESIKLLRATASGLDAMYVRPGRMASKHPNKKAKK